MGVLTWPILYQWFTGQNIPQVLPPKDAAEEVAKKASPIIGWALFALALFGLYKIINLFR